MENLLSLQGDFCLYFSSIRALRQLTMHIFMDIKQVWIPERSDEEPSAHFTDESFTI